jgi:hypothetical protein
MVFCVIQSCSFVDCYRLSRRTDFLFAQGRRLTRSNPAVKDHPASNPTAFPELKRLERETDKLPVNLVCVCVCVCVCVELCSTSTSLLISLVALLNVVYKQKLTPWLWSASELYRPSDRRLLAKLVPTFADRGVSSGQRNEFPRSLISVF